MSHPRSEFSTITLSKVVASSGLPAIIMVSWSDDVDVMVIGFGIGGGYEAVSAAASGVRVLMLEPSAAADDIAFCRRAFLPGWRNRGPAGDRSP